MATRPDLMCATSLLSRFMSKPSPLYHRVAKRMLRHVMGTMEYEIRFEKDSKLKLKGYYNNNLARSVDNMKSTLHHVLSWFQCTFLVFGIARNSGTIIN